MIKSILHKIKLKRQKSNLKLKKDALLYGILYGQFDKNDSNVIKLYMEINNGLKNLSYK